MRVFTEQGTRVHISAALRSVVVPRAAMGVKGSSLGSSWGKKKAWARRRRRDART